MLALAGKTALVTGAGRGIGRGIAERLAADGALVAVHYARNDAAARETVGAIRESGGRCFALRAELGVPGDVEELYGALDAGLAEQGAGRGLDIIVNNAAVSSSARIGSVEADTFDRIMAVNAKSPLLVIQEGLNRLRDGGRIVNVSSAVSRRALPETLVYAMSKAAVDTLTLTLAKELGARGITVNAVAPGFVATDMNARRRSTPQGEKALAALSVFNRIGRPADVADVVAFLVSDDARWITGQYVDVSGGSML
ncbi:SDR family oxidoreductase [Streptomyces sp. NPDC041068]|uniref:SDR family oxidoreductase n=1 Tax=Streptomyces sp. NPDC041068 TaxID=3155130 RepID=UPI0033C9FA44